jgi:protein-S-isoprenylcysteine O-methyltransferase Ste14
MMESEWRRFRSGIGLLLFALTVAIFLPILGREEAPLLSEFGEAYAACRMSTPGRSRQSQRAP